MRRGYERREESQLSFRIGEGNRFELPPYDFLGGWLQESGVPEEAWLSLSRSSLWIERPRGRRIQNGVLLIKVEGKTAIFERYNPVSQQREKLNCCLSDFEKFFPERSIDAVFLYLGQMIVRENALEVNDMMVRVLGSRILRHGCPVFVIERESSVHPGDSKSDRDKFVYQRKWLCRRRRGGYQGFDFRIVYFAPDRVDGGYVVWGVRTRKKAQRRPVDLEASLRRKPWGNRYLRTIGEDIVQSAWNEGLIQISEKKAWEILRNSSFPPYDLRRFVDGEGRMFVGECGGCLVAFLGGDWYMLAGCGDRGCPIYERFIAKEEECEKTHHFSDERDEARVLKEVIERGGSIHLVLNLICSGCNERYLQLYIDSYRKRGRWKRDWNISCGNCGDLGSLTVDLIDLIIKNPSSYIREVIRVNGHLVGGGQSSFVINDFVER